jgi:hypothetical protein
MARKPLDSRFRGNDTVGARASHQAAPRFAAS